MLHPYPWTTVVRWGSLRAFWMEKTEPLEAGAGNPEALLMPRSMFGMHFGAQSKDRQDAEGMQRLEDAGRAWLLSTCQSSRRQRSQDVKCPDALLRTRARAGGQH